MPSAAVIGPRGFVGSSVLAQLAAAGYRTVPLGRSDEPAAAQGCDLAFFCAGNSAPHLSSADPARCLQASVADLHGWLARLKARRWIVLSSVAVYPASLALKSEDSALDLRELSVYGAHKALAELYARSFGGDAVIVRAAYLFGRGLKKNLLYDLRQGATEHYLSADSALAPLDVALLAQAALALAEKAPAGTYNVASRHLLSAAQIAALKGGEHRFRGERRVDERGISLSKLERYWREPQSESEHRASISAFLRSP